MLQTSEKILTESICEALETMAFMMVMPPEEEPASPSESIHATMDFVGPTSGTIEIVIATEFAPMLAANVMGIDPDDDQARNNGPDAVKELLNTICGLVLPKLAESPADAFDVTIPSAASFSLPDEWEKFIAQSGAIVLDVDGITALAARLAITS